MVIYRAFLRKNLNRREISENRGPYLFVRRGMPKSFNHSKFYYLSYHDASEGVPGWIWLLILLFIGYVALRVILLMKEDKKKKG
jgi:hypothetical protein